MTRDYSHIDGYINKLYGEIYHQPVDSGHSRLAQKVIDHWCSRMTTCHSVLDVGAGVGFCQPMFERWGMSYCGVALGEDVIVAHENKRNVSVMDFSFLDFEDNSFDMLFARHSWEHSPMPLLTLFEWARVARHWLGIVLPAPEWYTYTGQNHYAVMNLEQAHHLLDVAGWKVMWEDIHYELFDKEKEGSRLPNEYWLMCEKKRE